MLSLEKCREVLGDGHDLGDEQLERLRADLYALAEAVSVYHEQAANQPAVDFRRMMQLADADRQADLEERAAIMEHDGGICRDAAERAALIHFGVVNEG